MTHAARDPSGISGISGRVSIHDLPLQVQEAVYALQLTFHKYTTYTQAQITFLELRELNEFVKPLIDVRGLSDTSETSR